MTNYRFMDPDPYRPAEPKATLTFLGPEKEKGIQVMTMSDTLTLKVNPPFRIVHDGSAYAGGDVFQAQDSDIVKFWITARWVESVPASRKGKA